MRRLFCSSISLFMPENSTSAAYILPNWQAPSNVKSLITTRNGGFSVGEFASFNLGLHVGDEEKNVLANRQKLAEDLKAQSPNFPPTCVWLNQVHGVNVIDAADFIHAKNPPAADAVFTRQKGVACIVMTADCLPVLLCDKKGEIVAAAHAGWRSLLNGVLENTIAKMQIAPENLMAYFGAAIGAQAFEVGLDVRDAFVAQNAINASAFIAHPSGKQDKFLADIYGLARLRLLAQGVTNISGGERCTFHEPEHFFSYRREGKTGRMASVIWQV